MNSIILLPPLSTSHWLHEKAPIKPPSFLTGYKDQLDSPANLDSLDKIFFSQPLTNSPQINRVLSTL